MASTLKLGNLANSVRSLSPTAQQDIQSARSKQELFAGLANTLSGKDYQPGMSPFESALMGATRGAEQGFKSKADMGVAKGQDELNAYVQQLAEKERQDAESLQYHETIQKANKQSALPYVAARVALAEGQMSQEEYSASVKNIISSNITTRGEELLSAEMQGGNPDVWAVQAKDPDTGNISTVIYNLPSELMQYAAEQDAEMGRAGALAVGRLPKGYLEKDKATGKAAELKAIKEAGITLTPEEEKTFLLGATSKGSGKSPESAIFGKKGTEEIQKKRGAIVNGAPERAAARGRISQVQELLASGTETGALTEMSSLALGVLGKALGVDFSSVTNVAQLNSALKGQLSGVLSIFGAGTGISNRDVDNAQLIIGTVENPADALRKIQAYAAANLVVTDEYAQKMTQLDLEQKSGRLTEEQALTQLSEFEASMFTRLQEQYNKELDKALGMQQNFMRTGNTAGVAPQVPAQEITIDLDGNIVE